MWEKGQSGNPKGRTPETVEQKKAKVLNRMEFESLLNKYIYMSLDELAAAKADASLPAIDRIVVQLLIITMKKGSVSNLDFILNRLIGKVDDNVNIKGNVHMGLIDVIKKRNGNA